jgi:hypothetical protein
LDNQKLVNAAMNAAYKAKKAGQPWVPPTAQALEDSEAAHEQADVTA